MPKVKPLTAAQGAQARWKRADARFRGQLGELMAQADLKIEDIASALGVSFKTVYARFHRPETLRKREERVLAELFARHGMRYDPLLDEAASERKEGKGWIA